MQSVIDRVNTLDDVVSSLPGSFSSANSAGGSSTSRHFYSPFTVQSNLQPGWSAPMWSQSVSNILEIAEYDL